MLYALLVYADQSPWSELTEEEAAAQRAEVMPGGSRRSGRSQRPILP